METVTYESADASRQRLAASVAGTDARKQATFPRTGGGDRGRQRNAPSSVGQTQVRSRLSSFRVRAAMKPVDLVTPIRDSS